MKAFFYIQTLLLAAAIYFSTTYLNNGLLRYFPKECDSVLVANLDQIRRVKGVHSISSSLTNLLKKSLPEFAKFDELLPLSAVDQFSMGEIFVGRAESHFVSGIVLNKPLPDLLKDFEEKNTSKKSVITVEKDEEDPMLYTISKKDKVLVHAYVLSVNKFLTFSPELKEQMLKRVNKTFLRSTIFSNEELQSIKKLETRDEMLWTLGLDNKDKNVEKGFVALKALNGQIVLEVNAKFTQVEMADNIFRMLNPLQEEIQKSTQKTPFSKFFTGKWLEFDVHSGTFKVVVRFSENLLGKHLPKLAKEINKLSMKDIEGFIKKAQKQQARAKKKK